MRIVLVSQWFPPEQAWLPADIAAELARRGHEVTVLTGFPNYPAGRIFDGWRQRPWTVTEQDGYRIRRVALYPSHDLSALRRVLNYLSFAITSTLFGWLLLRRADAVYVYHPPLTAALGPWLNRVLGGAPYTLHVLDLWPESVVTSDLVNGRAARLVGRLLGVACRGAYRRAGAVVCISPTMGRTLRDRGVVSEKLRVVLNWADESVFQPGEPDELVAERLGVTDRFAVMFAGNIGPAQDLETAVRAAARVRDLPDFLLVLVGGGIAVPMLQALVQELEATNVSFVPAQPFEAMAAVTRAADVHLISLRDLEFFRGAIPSKLGSVMATGLPVICAVNGEASRVVSESGGGWVCPAGDVDALAAAFREAHGVSSAERDARGQLARTYYERHMSRDVAAGLIGDAVEQVAVRT